jgi:mono/diheme cytochrome c family protein
MSASARWTAALLGAAILSGTALALGVGRPPRRENPGVAQIREEERTGPGRQLFTNHKCVMCHTADGGGTPLGPALGQVVPEYLAAAGGDAAAAKARLMAYLRDPKGVATLRRDTTKYPGPMPSAGGLGVDDAGMAHLADFLLRMKPPATAVGGDAGR